MFVYLNMYIYHMYICIDSYLYIYVYIYIHTQNVCVRGCVCLCVRLCVCVRALVCMGVCFFVLFVCLCIFTVLTWCVEWDNIRKFYKTYPQPHNTTDDATQN